MLLLWVHFRLSSLIIKPVKKICWKLSFYCAVASISCLIQILDPATKELFCTAFPTRNIATDNNSSKYRQYPTTQPKQFGD